MYMRLALGKRAILSVALCAVLASFALLVPASAQAAPGLLWEVPTAGPASGSGAGQFSDPLDVAGDPGTGNVFVSDLINARIDEFSPWGEFILAWGWGVRNGAAELQTCGPAATPPTTTCQSGIAGTGAGQFKLPAGLTVDKSGDIYVFDPENHRVQKFDSEGHFILMFGGKVNKTKVEAAAPVAEQNRCPIAPGDVCQAGLGGTGNGEFQTGQASDVVAAGPPGETIYVGDIGRIQKFTTAGEFTGEVKGEVGSHTVRVLDVDEAGDLGAILSEGSSPTASAEVLKLGPAGEKLVAYDVPQPNRGLTFDQHGNLFVTEANPASVETSRAGASRVLEFDPDGNKLIPSKAEEEENKAQEEKGKKLPFFGQIIGFTIQGIATNGAACREPDEEGTNLLVAYFHTLPAPESSSLRAYGPHPNSTLCPPPEAPPSITDQFAAVISGNSATLKARINSHFWPTTSYFVEWGTGKCSEGGCTRQTPLPPGLPLNSESSLPVATGGITVSALEPSTTYHYRFVARTIYQGASGSEVEVRGVGGQPGLDGAEASFTTAPATLLPAKVDCANQAFRTGASALLTDCRAYEMVSPVNKEGGEIFALLTAENFRASLDQSAASGERMTYSTFRAFGNAQASPYSGQYVASRGTAGWSNTPISPSRGHSLGPGAGVTTESEFKAFNEDLCQGWFRLEFEPEPVLDPAAVDGYINLYRRQECGGTPQYEALTTVTPPKSLPVEYFPELQGVSVDGRCALYRVHDALTPEAPELSAEGAVVLYEQCSGEPLRLVAVLPNGSVNPSGSSAGTAESTSQFRAEHTGTVFHAMSDDGSRVYWSSTSEGPGQLFLRLNADQEPTASGSCDPSEPSKACTIVVSPGSARFWTAAPDGSRAIYEEAGKLFEFFVQIESGEPVVERTLIAEGTLGVMGASEDATRVYFASSKALGGHGQVGQPNLYYHEIGQEPAFIATLSPDDSYFTGDPSKTSFAITPQPYSRTSRVTPDGLHVAFTSHAPLTNFNNTDQNSGEADAEMFVYDAADGNLVCVSCNPNGARPAGRNLGSEARQVWAAAVIPGWESQLQAPRPLSAEGNQLFFDSFESLLPRDVNGKEDVYEWESAGSEAECEGLGAERYVAAADGCLSLISSGEGNRDSEFLDASTSGRDVFFATEVSLLSQDDGGYDIYDARVGGGFPPPPTSPETCIEEGCQHGAPAPSGKGGMTGTSGAGNATNQKPSCGKGQRAVKKHGKWRCVKKKQKRHHHSGKKGHHKGKGKPGKQKGHAKSGKQVRNGRAG